MTLDLPPPDSLLASIPHPVIVLDTRRDRIVNWSPEAADLLTGSTATPPAPFAQYLGKDLPQFIVFLDAVHHRGEGWTRDVTLTRADGTPLRVELRAQPVPGRPDHVAMILTDLHAFDRRTDLAILHAIGFGAGKHEFAIGNVNLTATKTNGPDTVFDIGHQIVRI